MHHRSPMPVLRVIARRFAQIQRITWACCTPSSETQCLVLTELYQDPGLSIRGLAERIGSDPPWVSRVVETMRTQEWVERIPDPRDRRHVMVHLTDGGRQQAARLQEALNRQADQILARLPVARRAQALTALEWIAESLEQEYQAIRTPP